MKLTKERMMVAGVALLLAGSGSVLTEKGVPQAAEKYQQIRTREDILAGSIGRPLALDIDAARTTLRPEMASTQIPDYYGDEESCNPLRRQRYEMVDSACRLLTRAGERLDRWADLVTQDEELKKLHVEHESRFTRQISMVFGGLGAMGVGVAVFFLSVGRTSSPEKHSGEPQTVS